MPADTPEGAVVMGDPGFQRRDVIHQAGRAGVVEMSDRSDLGKVRQHRAEQATGALWRRNSGGIAQGDELHPAPGKLFNTRQYSSLADTSLKRTAERHGNRADQAELIERLIGHLFYVQPLVFAAALEVFQRVRLRGGYQQADFIGAVAGGEVADRPLHCSHVGAGRFIENPSTPLQRRQQRTGVGKLWNHRGIGVGGCFYSLKADLGESLHQLAFYRSGQKVRFVLQTVAGETFTQDDVSH
ncbi:hypothetical protein D3C87_1407020 [compost metagenome]